MKYLIMLGLLIGCSSGSIEKYKIGDCLEHRQAIVRVVDIKDHFYMLEVDIWGMGNITSKRMPIPLMDDQNPKVIKCEGNRK